MEQRTQLYQAGDQAGISALEKQLLAQNAQYKNWACTEEMMSRTKDGKALYLHCLPADITGLSCAEGEVDNSVFDRYLVPLYKQASYKPYVIAAMIHQHFKLVDVFTAAENIVLGLHEAGKLDRKVIAAKVREISDRYGFDIDPNQKVYDMLAMLIASSASTRATSATVP